MEAGQSRPLQRRGEACFAPPDDQSTEWPSQARPSRSLAPAARLLTLPGRGTALGRRGSAAIDGMSYVDAALAPQRKTGQIKLHGSAAFEGMRKAGQLVAECLDMLARRNSARRAHGKNRSPGVRISRSTTMPCPRL